MPSDAQASRAEIRARALADAIEAVIAKDRITRQTLALRAGLALSQIYRLLSDRAHEHEPTRRTLRRLASAGVRLPSTFTTLRDN